MPAPCTLFMRAPSCAFKLKDRQATIIDRIIFFISICFSVKISSIGNKGLDFIQGFGVLHYFNHINIGLPIYFIAKSLL